jgi:hypothetical protein
MQVGQNEPFPLQLASVPEVQQVPDRLSGDPHVIEQLSFVVACEFSDGLEFHNDGVENDQIRLIACLKAVILIEHAEFALRVERNAAQAQFDFETLLIDLLSAMP